MIWSGWDGDLGMELYIASRYHTDASQYESSQRALRLLQSLQAIDRIHVIPLDNLTHKRDEFAILAKPGSRIALPFLISAFGCETGALEGHSGLDEVTLAITRLMPTRPNTQNHQ